MEGAVSENRPSEANPMARSSHAADSEQAGSPWGSSQDPREERLPKWAQDALAHARRTAADALREREEARLATNPDETDTLVDPYGKPPIGLPKGERVRFLTGGSDRDWIDVRVDRDGYLKVMGETRLVIYAQASNVVFMRVGRL
jgi:hypothetical protein